ncbi:MAG: hypothetical protein LPK45_09385, partial [Bacteroidota bacterium]|nr:hypothetical protein [Bacteroidota bacterium]MDX5431298.1 hypothetical protein [Bacteroidota bacterium]MDX5470036.1 hypothetical protein [Bacteroidota bacterium]
TKKLQVELAVVDPKDFHATTYVLAAPFRKPGKKVFFGDYLDIDYVKQGFMAAWTSYEKPKGIFSKRRLCVRVKKLQVNSAL